MPLRVALLFGGPSPERGISLNSARSVADHLDGAGVELAALVYFDGRIRPYRVSRPLLYSNTPDDFDFKLGLTSAPLRPAELVALLRSCDLAFPVMHGAFGEDGTVQALLEEAGVPFVGSGSGACAVAYDKGRSLAALAAAGIDVVPTAAVGAGDDPAAAIASVGAGGAMVSKPTAGGSSLGVVVHADAAAARAAVGAQAARYGEVVVQPWVDGVEVTTVVVEGPGGPVALPPVEIELVRGGEHQILSYRHKYLASDDTRYHCPPRMDAGVVAQVRATAEAAFGALGLRDFARIDARLTPDGRVVVSDVNPVSGMEQNSFLFIAAAQAGMTHRDVLGLVVGRAASRCGLEAPGRPEGGGEERQPVLVLFGGATAERQVSVLSGTNVWLKLLHSRRYEPRPALLCGDGSVWLLTYPVALRHTVEEITAACEDRGAGAALAADLRAEVTQRLRLEPWQCGAGSEPPRRVALDEAVAGHRFVFLALHGGSGEDGTLQAWLDDRDIAYNGSGPEASALAMDKYRTGEVVAGLGDPAIATAARVRLGVPGGADDLDAVWDDASASCGTAELVVKPLADGCSAGVVPLAGAKELGVYVEALRRGEGRIGPGTFALLGADQVVELPPPGIGSLMLEAFVATDRVAVVPGDDAVASHLAWNDDGGGWVEVTVGVLGARGRMRAMAPSMTIAAAGVLSLEEKFMGGTGVNITPPPGPPLGRFGPGALDALRAHVETVAGALGLDGYARIDAFVHRVTGDVVVIEANSLPGLTPSTVLYHQALAEKPPMYPADLLQQIIDLGLRRAADA